MKGCKKIMLIDDDPDDRQLFSEALSEVDDSCKLIAAATSESAIEMLQENKANLPDFIFLDLNMPGKNGWQCLEELRKVNYLKAVPVVIYTTSRASQKFDNIPKQENLFFISKPSRFSHIKEAIRLVILRQWKGIETLNKSLFPGTTPSANKETSSRFS